MKIKIITESALQIDEIKAKILHQQDTCIIHLICIFLFRDTDYVNHWINEVRGFIPRVPKVKSTKQYPKYRKINEWLLDGWEDSFYDQLGSYLETIEYKEDDLEIPSIFNESNLHDFLVEYFDWLAINLSQKGSVEGKSIRSQIDYLLEKYPIK